MIGLGARTLFVKEVRRFLRVPGQTVMAPLVSTALYLAVFGYALGGRIREVAGVPYLAYIVPGLVMLGMISNAFLNASSSMIIMKVQGTLVDLLVTPLGPLEITLSMVLASVLRAAIVGGLTLLAAAVALGGVPVADPLLAVAFPALTGIGFGALGLLTGLWAEKFEQVNFVPTFVLTPLTFLGGVFYDVRGLPEPFATLSRANPVLYVVEGFRHGLLGASAVDPWVGLAFLLVLDVLAVAACALLLRAGWRVRS